MILFNIIPEGVDVLKPDIKLRPLDKSDIDNFIELQKEVFLDGIDFDDVSVRTVFTDIFEGKEIKYAIIDNDTGTFYGCCGCKDLNKDKPELDIELFKRFHNRGIGTNAVLMLMSILSKQKKVSSFTATVEPDNYASQRLLQKLGATPAGIIISIYISEKYIDKYETDNIGLINDNLRCIAEIFSVEPKTLLTHDLIFNIPAPDIDNINSVIQDKGEYIFDNDRKRSVAIRKYGKDRIINEVLEMLENRKDEDFELVKKDVVSHLESYVK